MINTQNMGLRFIAPILHDEIIHFESGISKFIFDTEDLCNTLVNKIKSLAYQIDPALVVKPTQNFEILIF